MVLVVRNYGKKRYDVLKLALIVLNLTIRVYSAFYMIISDCDETFNYWEPLNLLVRGFGKQTWEYSPEYAIRSYAYLVPYYVLSWPISVIGRFFSVPAYYHFYWIRFVGLCGMTSFAEIRLFDSLGKNLGRSTANWYLFLSSVAPGMSHAGVALLPSSFGMNCIFLALSHALNYSIPAQLIKLYSYCICWILAGGVIGWPFVLALGVAPGIYALSIHITSVSRFTRLLTGCVVGLVALVAFSVTIDSIFYHKVDFVPLNIVLYNVFGQEGEGPEIFGVEPFSYYILNLLVNFNVVALISYVGLLVNPLLLSENHRAKVLINVCLPQLIWTTIFGSQPHKEERFLYPLYPYLILNSSILLSLAIPFASRIISKVFKNRISSRVVCKLIQILGALVVALVSILRIMNLVENYSAPLISFSLLASVPVSNETTNVCIGREWYHFPNSFFLPDNTRLKFVRSGFDGLLPGDFEEGKSLFEVTSSIPLDMNNKNLYSPRKVIPFEECSYYIDNSQPVDVEINEPEIISKRQGDTATAHGWTLLKCAKIIDPSGNSSGVGRYIWLPNFLRRFLPYNVDYMDFCIAEKIALDTII